MQIRFFFGSSFTGMNASAGMAMGPRTNSITVLFEIQSFTPRLSYATIIRTSFQSNCSPSFSNLIIYLYFSSLLRFFVSRNKLLWSMWVLFVHHFACRVCTKKKRLVPWKFEIPFSGKENFSFVWFFCRVYLEELLSPSKIARETCICYLAQKLPKLSRSLVHPISKYRNRKKNTRRVPKDVWSNANISFSLCVSLMWIRCPVSSRRCTKRVFSSSSTGAEKGAQGKAWVDGKTIYECVFYIFQYLSCQKGHGDVSNMNMHRCRSKGRAHHSSSRTLNGTEAFSVIFSSSTDPCWRCYE